MDRTTLPNRARWGLGGLGALVLALIVGVVMLRPGVDDLDPGTPEGTAQGYLRAVLDGDRRAALGFLTPALQQACRREAGLMWAPESARITLAGTHVEGETAEVDVVVTWLGEPGLFEAVGETMDMTLYLERSETGWAIGEPPWPLWTCEEKP